MKNTISLSQRLNGSFNNTYLNNDNLNTDNNENVDIIDFNYSKLSHRSKWDNSQLNKIKKLIGDKNDINSEFFYENKGKSFSKDSKEFSWNNKVYKKEIIPGPNQYDPIKSLKYLDSTKGITKFNKKVKEFWIDEQPKPYSPGPIYNPKKAMISR